MEYGITDLPPFSNTILIAFVLAVLFGFVLRWIRSGEKSWTNANSAIKPNLNAGDPPIIQTRRGVFGCLQAALLRFVVGPILIILALDFLIFQGQIFEAVLAQVR